MTILSAYCRILRNARVKPINAAILLYVILGIKRYWLSSECFQASKATVGKMNLAKNDDFVSLISYILKTVLSVLRCFLARLPSSSHSDFRRPWSVSAFSAFRLLGNVLLRMGRGYAGCQNFNPDVWTVWSMAPLFFIQS